MTQPSSVDQVGRALAKRLQGTPYLVEPHEGGIRITVNIVDSSWWRLAQLHHLNETFEVTLTPESPGVFTRLDEMRSLQWITGTPVLGTVNERVRRGRLHIHKRIIGSAVDADGVERPIDVDFSTSRINGILKEVLREHGWSVSRKLDGGIKGALVAGIIGIGIAVAIGVALIVLGVTGQLG